MATRNLTSRFELFRRQLAPTRKKRNEDSGVGDSYRPHSNTIKGTTTDSAHSHRCSSHQTPSHHLYHLNRFSFSLPVLLVCYECCSPLCFHSRFYSRSAPRVDNKGRHVRIPDASPDEEELNAMESGSSSSSSSSRPSRSLPPVWVDVVDEIHRDLTTIRSHLKSLSSLHSSRLRVSFGDDEVSEQERDIEILTRDITKLLTRCQNSVKRIAVVGNDGRLTAQESNVRQNVMRSLALEIQQVSQKFKQQQKSFLSAIREQEQVGQQFGFTDYDKHSSVSLDDAVDRGLTQDQLQQMHQMEAQASEREREIIKIAQSINELASLMNDLNVLVIEQGSILDRIDYNVEKTLDQVKKGNVQLKKADDYSRKNWTLKCILVLILICAVLLLILILKHSII